MPEPPNVFEVWTMARPMFTQEQVFEVADAVAADGKEVTALVLLSKLGGASLTTIYKHLIAWRDARKQDAIPANAAAIPEAVQAAFATALGRTWGAAVTEAAKEVTAAKEKAQEEVQTANKQFEEAMQAIEKLEDQADSDMAKIENLSGRLAELEAALQKAENDKAGLTATLEQVQNQVKSQETEFERIRKEAEAERKRHQEEMKEAASTAGQIEALKGQNSELIAKLAERGKQGK